MTKHAFTVKEEIEALKQKLASNDIWAKRALVRIFEAQTQNEQSANSTLHNNGIGFTSSDAKILSRIVKYYLSYGRIDDYFMHIVHARIPKYARQIFSLSDFDHTKFDNMLKNAVD